MDELILHIGYFGAHGGSYSLLGPSSSAATCTLRNLLSFGSVALRSIIILHGSDFGIPLGNERELETVTLGKLDLRLLALTNDENVAETSGESLALGVPDVDNLVGTGVVLDVHEDAGTTNIVSTGNEDRRSIFEFNHSIDLSSLKVKLFASMKSIKYNHFGKKRALQKNRNIPSRCRSS